MALLKEKVTEIHHWTDKTFSFKTTRDMSFRFKNGEFAMIGMEHEGKKVMRAYSFASANHEDYLEFLSIKIVLSFTLFELPVRFFLNKSFISLTSVFENEFLVSMH